MDYIKEINAFFIWLETNGLSHPARHLWHVLMHTANRTGWQVPFSVAMKTLEIKTGMNRKAIERARNELAQAGRIRWKSRTGNQSARYWVEPLAGQFVRQNSSENVAQSSEQEFVRQNEPQNVAQPVAQSVAQPVAITKQRHTQNKKNTAVGSACAREDGGGSTAALELNLSASRIEEAAKGIGLPLGSRHFEKINLLIADYGADWILEAIERTATGPSIAWNYVEGILRNWRGKGKIDAPRASAGHHAIKRDELVDPSVNPFEEYLPKEEE